MNEREVERYLRGERRFGSIDIVDKYQQVLEILDGEKNQKLTYQVHLVKSSEMGWEIISYIWYAEKSSVTLTYIDLMPYTSEDGLVIYLNDFDQYLDRLRELVS